MDLTKYRSVGLVVGITLVVYLRVLNADFVNLDDPYYVINNPAIRLLDWTFVRESFTTSYMGWWMPLTWISFAIDYAVWGLNPFGYHLTNMLLHGINAGLVVLIADSLVHSFSRYPAMQHSSAVQSVDQPLEMIPEKLHATVLLVAGLCWSIHPLRVESVAWVTERKDVLSGLFSLGSLLCYLHYATGQTAIGRKAFHSWYYVCSLLLFLLALLAKPVSVVLPAMYLVVDWFPLQRLRSGAMLKVITEKLPFLVLSLLIAWATLHFAASESILVSLADYPFWKRLLVAGYAVSEYVRMSIVPAGLAHLYLLPKSFGAMHYVYTALSLLITWYCIVTRRRYPWLLATWLLYLLPLLPVLGFFQNGSQSHADRFTYLPAVIPSITAAVCSTLAYARLMTIGGPLLRAAYPAGCLLMLAGYTAVTFSLIGVWQNSASLWSRLIAVAPIGRAYYYRSDYYLEKGNYAAASSDMKIAIRYAHETGNPELYYFYAILGDAQSRSGNFAEAVDAFTQAIQLRPQPNYYYHRGKALQNLGKEMEAAADFAAAGQATEPIITQNQR